MAGRSRGPRLARSAARLVATPTLRCRLPARVRHPSLQRGVRSAAVEQRTKWYHDGRTVALVMVGVAGLLLAVLLMAGAYVDDVRRIWDALTS